MAFIQVNTMSESLYRTVNVNVILPADKIVMPDQKDQKIEKVKEFKTLYLLHGIFGSQVDWINGTNVQRWAEEKNLAVVMPAGENRFYVDQPATHDYYGRFIGEELVNVTRNMFPLSDKKEDTFICGLSMGGYGALRNGLKYSDTFGYVGALSAASMVDITDGTLSFMQDGYLEAVFGDLKKARNSDVSIDWLIRNNRNKDQKFYVACGESDPLMYHSKHIYDLLKKENYDVTFETGPGAHEWDFWNRYIKNVIDWLPLGEQQSGINSGNIGK
ncbi:MAG: acetylesterase [Erysipelotrichaceae bacterium]|nr:acetylesterase [Erysipelotrichaceae bacterium]